ncbi:hypothetical protein B7463_g10466, partial [Scytalidium lignicola]
MAPSGISMGVAAGIGIGSGAAFCIAIGLAAFYFFRKRIRLPPVVTDLPSVTDLPVPLFTGSPHSLHSFLLDGSRGSDFTREIRSLGVLIEQHVKSRYHLDAVEDISHLLNGYLELMCLSEHLRSRITELAMDPSTRHLAIRHLLVHMIFENLDIHSVGPFSLLPPIVVKFITSIPKYDTYDTDTRVATAFMYWRRITAFLMQKHELRRFRYSLTPPSTIEPQIEILITYLNMFLDHFAVTDAPEKSNDLETVIRECVKLGYTVFSHACEWRFTFAKKYYFAREGIAVLPGLQMLNDPSGNPCDLEEDEGALPTVVFLDEIGK